MVCSPNAKLIADYNNGEKLYTTTKECHFRFL